MTCIALKLNPSHDRPWDHKLNRDLKTLVRFVEVYCHGKHGEAEKTPCSVQLADGQEVIAKPPTLCDECQKLLTHAIVKRSVCPMRPKPQCKHCPRHCYARKYRVQIREVMKYSGMRIMMSGRLDYLLHLLF